MQDPERAPPPPRLVLALGGNMMTGRGVDQVLPHPGAPRLWESYAKSALDYVALAEAESGSVPQPLAYEELWGEALELLEASNAAARVVNLETSVTAAGEPWEGKAVHDRMSPENAPVLAAAELSCVSLANNHALDFGAAGLLETVAALERVGVRQAGAGRTLAQARAPAVVPLAGGGRLLVFGVGSITSGIPRAWARRTRARAPAAGAEHLERVLDHEGAALGTRVERRPEGTLVLRWDRAPLSPGARP